MARTLKRYGVTSGALGVHVSVQGAAVPAARAQVLNIIVNNNGGEGAQFHLSVGAAGGGSGYIAVSIPLNPGEVYKETGVVVAAGEQLWVASVDIANAVICHASGEEVDN
jgi:hypothetical protein